MKPLDIEIPLEQLEIMTCLQLLDFLKTVGLIDVVYINDTAVVNTGQKEDVDV